MASSKDRSQENHSKEKKANPNKSKLLYLSKVYGSSNIGVLTINAAGTIIYFNPAVLRICGLDKKELSGKSFFNIFTDTSADPLNETRLTGQTAITDREFKVNGQADERWVLINSEIADGTASGAHTTVFIRDISKTKKKEKLFAYLNLAATDLVKTRDTQTALDKIAGFIVPAFANWFTIDRLKDGRLEQLLVKHQDPDKIEWAHIYRKNYPPDPNGNTGAAVVLKTGEPGFVPVITDEMIAAIVTDPVQLKAVRQIGLKSLIVVPMFNKEAVTGVVNFILSNEGRHFDEIDLKFAQNFASLIGLVLENTRLNEEAQNEIGKRRQSEEQFRFLADAIPHKLWTSAPDGRATYYNQQWYDYTGISGFEALRENIWDIIHPDDRAFAAAEWPKAVQSGEGIEMEHRFRRYDGAYRWHASRFVSHKNDDGQVILWVGTSTDINEQKESRLEIEHANESLHSSNDELATVNEELYASNEELVVVNEELSASNEELATSNEELTETQANLRRIAQELADSDARFRSLVQWAPVAIAVITGEALILESANDMMLKMWGKPQTIIGKKLQAGLRAPESQSYLQLFGNVLASGRPYFGYADSSFPGHGGRPGESYIDFVCQPLNFSAGKANSVMVVAIDVTEQVTAKRDLEEAYEQVHLSKEAAQLGTFDMDLLRGTMMWDDRCRALFGISHTGNVSYEKDFVTGLHLDDKQRVLEIIARVMNKAVSNGDYDIEYRTVGVDDGRIRWVRAKGKVYFNESDIPVRFIGSVLDITQQKLHEINLAENAERLGRLAAIIESSDDIIISKTLQGIITSWNKSAERMFGYSQEEAIGRHISLVIPPSRLKEEEFIIERIKAGKSVDHFETLRLTKDGREIPLSLTVSPVVDAAGKVIGASKIARDISSRLAADEAAMHYTQSLETINFLIETISEELELNKVLQKVTDITTELTGANFGAFFYNSTDEHGESLLLYTISGAPREAFEKFGMPRNTAIFNPTFMGEGIIRSDDITKDPRYGKNKPHHGIPKGHLPVVSYLAVPVISRSGAAIGGLFFGHSEPGVFTRDHETLVSAIAAQAAIGIDNAKLFEQVKELNEKKDEFIGLASHELKTPLTSINGYLQILNKMIKDEQSQKFVSRTLHQVTKLTSLVNDLLDVSKIEAGKLQLSVDLFNLREVIEETIELIQHTNDKYEITFETAIESCPVMADSQRIGQVLINLLTNAIKYSPGTDKIIVSLNRGNKNIIVGVRDFGMGIPAEQQSQIFSRFYRVEEGNRNISGLGIGLYISSEIITRHNGKIWVESGIGKGSAFYFSLPVTE